MSKKSKVSAILLFLSLGFLFLFAQAAYSATVVSIQTSGPLAGVVGGFQFNILGPTLTDSSDFTPSLPAGWIDGSFGTPSATVNYFDGSSAAALTSGPIGSFQTVDASLDLNSFLLFNQLGNQIPLVNYAVEQIGTDYNITGVPIPGSILLLGSGLIGLIGIARRKMSS